ncbi:unnamed protein product [Callosobruchus maculatus]|uniref:Uncharacterized protein n=1 Tax=Callosobruchus maculatus TaxID=64391 RepID=A0A653D2Q2_CALMS|nr:unnamed protein product [Callosobruchus maculatus]
MYIHIEATHPENHSILEAKENRTNSSSSINHPLNSSSMLMQSTNADNVAKLWTRQSTLQFTEFYKNYEKQFDTMLKKFVWQKIANLYPRARL